MDRKVISIRADETIQKDLKILAKLKELSVGEVLESLIREEMRRMKKGKNLLDQREAIEVKHSDRKPVTSNSVRSDSEPVKPVWSVRKYEPALVAQEPETSGNNKKNKKKKRR